mmetsp:Transcript_7445/g.19422  ORF Transcript_7445/g.19422 Transcript_7445/m.19422 type:complete len:181 (-) Transcript_7445:2163-2705(-)
MRSSVTAGTSGIPRYTILLSSRSDGRSGGGVFGLCSSDPVAAAAGAAEPSTSGTRAALDAHTNDDDDDDGDDDDESDNFEWCSQKNNHTIAANHLTQKNGVVIISDQSHPPMTIKMYVNARPSMVAILRSISGAMPVRVRQLVIVNAPAAFRVAWKILCSLPGPVISPKLKERLMMVVTS